MKSIFVKKRKSFFEEALNIFSQNLFGVRKIRSKKGCSLCAILFFTMELPLEMNANAIRVYFSVCAWGFSGLTIQPKNFWRNFLVEDYHFRGGARQPLYLAPQVREKALGCDLLHCGLLPRASLSHFSKSDIFSERF